jgi:hypothetical protein
MVHRILLSSNRARWENHLKVDHPWKIHILYEFFFLNGHILYEWFWKNVNLKKNTNLLNNMNNAICIVIRNRYKENDGLNISPLDLSHWVLTLPSFMTCYQCGLQNTYFMFGLLLWVLLLNIVWCNQERMPSNRK